MRRKKVVEISNSPEIFSDLLNTTMISLLQTRALRNCKKQVYHISLSLTKNKERIDKKDALDIGVSQLRKKLKGFVQALTRD